jgi:hypothetical protein
MWDGWSFVVCTAVTTCAQAAAVTWAKSRPLRPWCARMHYRPRVCSQETYLYDAHVNTLITYCGLYDPPHIYKSWRHLPICPNRLSYTLHTAMVCYSVMHTAMVMCDHVLYLPPSSLPIMTTSTRRWMCGPCNGTSKACCDVKTAAVHSRTDSHFTFACSRSRRMVHRDIDLGGMHDSQ